MRQNGHAVDFTGRYDQTRVDYDRTPIKPVVDGEPIYEDHPGQLQRRHPRPLDRRRRAASALLGSVRRRVRPHLRPSLGLAVHGRPGAPRQQPADAVVRGDRAARRGADAARAARCSNRGRFSPAFRTTDLVVTGPVPTSSAGNRPLPFRRDPRCKRKLRDGLRAGRPAVHRAHEQDRGSRGVSVVVQPSRPAKPPRSTRWPNSGRSHLHPAGCRQR